MINSSNGTLNIVSSNNPNVNNYTNTKLIKRQTSFNSRNGNNNSTYNFGNDLNSSNIFQTANSTGTGRAYTPLSASNQNHLTHSNANNPSNQTANNKTSLSLDNVFTNLDLIITNDAYLSARPSNNMHHQANFLNTYNYRPNAHQPPLINNNGTKKIDLNNLNQYKTATITTINLLNNNYNPAANSNPNKLLTNDTNNNSAIGANLNHQTSIVSGLLARKRPQKLEYDASDQHLNAHPPGMSLQSLNEESVENMKPTASLSSKILNNNAVKNGANGANQEMNTHETHQETKVADKKDKENVNLQESEERPPQSSREIPNENPLEDENRKLNSTEKQKESSLLDSHQQQTRLPTSDPLESEGTFLVNKKVVDPFSAATEPRVSMASINDSQKLRTTSKQLLNPSRSNSTYYNNVNNNLNGININGVNNFRLQKKSLDSNENGSPQLHQLSYKNSGLEQARTKLNQNNFEEEASRVSYVSRDVNDSYAYTNVQQYIEENDLMPPDKAMSIRKWINKVNSWCDDWEKRTIESNIEDSV